MPISMDKEKKKAEKPKLVVPDVPCGKETINDHEKRLCILEQQVIPDLLKRIEELKSAGQQR